MPRRHFIPKRTKDRLLFSFLVGGVPFAVLFVFLLILPEYHPYCSLATLFHAVVTAWIVTNITANLYYLIVTDTSPNRMIISNLLPEADTTLGESAKKFCDKCQLEVPKRSHHCELCDICILKRSHHCRFSGCCVGFYNQRYFVILVLHLAGGALYGHWFSLEYFLSRLGGLKLSTGLGLLQPHLATLVGLLDVRQFALACLWDVAFLALVTSLGMFLRQAWLVYFGQTMYEAQRGVLPLCCAPRNPGVSGGVVRDGARLPAGLGDVGTENSVSRVVSAEGVASNDGTLPGDASARNGKIRHETVPFSGEVAQIGLFSGEVAQTGHFSGEVAQTGLSEQAQTCHFGGDVAQTGRFSEDLVQTGQFSGEVAQTGLFSVEVTQTGHCSGSRVERWRKRFAHHLDHVAEVLGRRWWLVWAWPWLESPLPLRIPDTTSPPALGVQAQVGKAAEGPKTKEV